MNTELFFRPLTVADLYDTKVAPKAGASWIGATGSFQFLGEIGMSGTTWVPPIGPRSEPFSQSEVALAEVKLVVRSPSAARQIKALGEKLGMPLASVPYSEELAEELLKRRFGDDFEAFSEFFRSIGSPAAFGNYYRHEMMVKVPKEQWPLMDLAWRLPPILREYYHRGSYSVFGGKPVETESFSAEDRQTAIRQAFDALKSKS